MKSQLGGLRRKFMNNQLITTQSWGDKNKSAQKEENAIEWLTLF